MKNYHEEKPRKFTLLKLEIPNFDTLDILSLSLFGISLIIQSILIYYDFKKYQMGLFLISFSIYILTTTTPFGLRFRNIYFSIIWLILCLIFMLSGNFISLVPFATFILYHITRVIFWKKYDKEFIPYKMGKAINKYSAKDMFKMNMARYVSKLDGRGGYIEDRNFMKYLFWFGLIIFLTCFIVAIPDFKHK